MITQVSPVGRESSLFVFEDVRVVLTVRELYIENIDAWPCACDG